MKLIKIFILGTLILLSSFLNAGITNTKHNLSVTSPGTVKAVSEAEICVFCHIPHFAQAVGKPLWNRSMPASNYTMYDSNHLRRLGYPEMETDLGSANDTPGALSRQCLSCHDGTVAVGSVSKLRREHDATIAMSGVDGDGTILPSTGGYIGTDLSSHHPVGVIYDSTVVKNFGTGTKTAELEANPASPIKLYEYPGYAGKYVECSSCHDPHKEAPNANGGSNKFLHVSTNDTLAANILETCTTCHDKRPAGGSPNPHQSLDMPYTDITIEDKYGARTISTLFCINCHTPHNAAANQPYLQRKIEQNTCFMGAGDDRNVAPCHGTGSTVESADIESLLDRDYSHGMVKDIDGVHTNLDVFYGTGVTRYPSGSKGLAFSDSQHVECVDCHNPHRVTVTSKNYYPGTTYLATPTNEISGILKGVTGVEPTWPISWTQPTTYTTMAESTKEYQICFKCHSYWGLGASIAPNNPSSTYPSVSDPFNVPLTDVAWELNKNNKSGHPVVFPNSAAGRTGSYTPQALSTLQMTDPWKNVGNNTMYCSDCHGADNQLNGVDSKGPHGSSKKFMLSSSSGNYYWPTKPGSTILYDTDDIGTTGDSGNFCKNCHDINEPHARWAGPMRRRNYSCVTCHVAVPHGSPVSRLIGYSTFPAPYNYNGDSLKMAGFKKNALTSIIRSDVYATSGCMGCHGSNAGGYDASPFP